MNSISQEIVSHIGEGLHSITQLPELRALTHITTLNLHGNCLSRIEGIQHLCFLTNLNLSSNSITTIENLSGLASLTNLNLASNGIQTVQGLAGLQQLSQLNVAYNYITNIAGISELYGEQPRLVKLNLSHNAITSLQMLAPLAGCLALRQLRLGGNPCVYSPAAYAAVKQALPQVQDLDDKEAVSISMGLQMASMQLHAFDSSQSQQSAGPMTSAAAGLNGWQQFPQQWEQTQQAFNHQQQEQQQQPHTNRPAHQQQIKSKNRTRKLQQLRHQDVTPVSSSHDDSGNNISTFVDVGRLLWCHLFCWSNIIA